MNKKYLWVVLIIVVLLGIFVLAGSLKGANTKSLELTDGQVGSTEGVQTGTDWKNRDLKDIKTGELFKISGFEGTPVLIESFAVWCPTCTKQQKEIKKLHEEIGDSVISISLDTDPNEDEEKILNHVQENGFDWYYAVSPIEMTKSLIDEFGTRVINAPSTPMILVCEDGSYRKLRGSGSRDVEKLKEEIASGC